MRNILLIIIAVMFCGCFDINLKNKLPNMQYYTLDNVVVEGDSNTCHSYNFFGLNDIDILPVYQSRNILYKDSNKVLNIKGASLSNSLKSELESIIIKYFSTKCIKVITPPFSGMNIKQFIRIKLLDFIIDKNTMQAKVSILYYIYQNGNVLQSGILSSQTALSSLDKDEAVKALQDSTLDVVHKLSNKITTK